MVLIWAIAAFLAADISLALVWYLLSEEDPNSPNYVPSDWKELVLANLGVSKGAAVPAQYIGVWKADNQTITFHPSGTFSRTETLPGSEELRLQSNGSIVAADPDYITVKTTTTERIRIGQAPQPGSEGWTLQINGEQFKKDVLQKDSL